MFKALFIANDPGGYNVIYPLYQQMKNDNCKLILIGSAGDINPGYRLTESFSDSVRFWLETNRDAILVTGTSWNNQNEMEAVFMARQMGIKTVSIIDYWGNYLERFKYKNNYLFPDYIFIMDELSKKEAVAEGIPTNLLMITGQPLLDKYISSSRNVENITNGKVLFLSQPLSEFKGLGYGYTEFYVAQDVIRACQALNLELNIKFHPKETELFKKVFSDYSIDDDSDVLTVKNYDTIIGMNTMGLLESVLMGKRTISYQPYMTGQDVCITNKLGFTKGAFCYDELIERLQKKDTSNIFINSNFIWKDGKSTERCCNELLKIYSDCIYKRVKLDEDYNK